MPNVRVPGFLPSTSAPHFPNRFARAPVMRLGVGAMRLPVGNAARGLCGGMVFAARDLFEAGTPPPSATEAPQAGTPMFRYLVKRLFDSWRLPWGPLRYAVWSAIPDADWLGRPGLARRTAEREWPRIRAELDAGRPAPLGLIRVRTLNPWKLAHNHQVLAYGYDLDEATGDVVLSLYDPNRPDEDDVRLALDVRAPLMGWPAPYGSADRAVRGAFLVRYRAPGRARSLLEPPDGPSNSG